MVSGELTEYTNTEGFSYELTNIEVLNSRVTKSSNETELLKMMSHFELLTRKSL